MTDDKMRFRKLLAEEYRRHDFIDQANAVLDGTGTGIMELVILPAMSRAYELDRGVDDERHAYDCDRHYLNGVTAGWNAAQSDNPNDAKDCVVRSREQSIKEYRRAAFPNAKEPGE